MGRGKGIFEKRENFSGGNCVGASFCGMLINRQFKYGANDKVLIKLFQKFADSKGSAFGRASQSAECLMLPKLRRGRGNSPGDCFLVGAP